MTAATLKEELKRIVDEGDEDLLMYLYEAASGYSENEDVDITEEDVKELERRTAGRKSGESKLYTLDEVRARITKKNEL